ncbi:hypothetical protein N431DRAFT_382769 [Stipitochalara longipes BDJ]|nr:hypothetical protein N431DRAFT_382769 [Stipitochalara longipes BDJ]
MADQNSYIRYKKETNRLLFWVIHTSNSIIKSASGFAPDADDVLPKVNTTGQITVSALVSLSKLIAKHINPIPSTIYRLFQSVIDARLAANSLFQQIATENPDPEIERSNASHKLFIEALSSAFKALGGEEWKLRCKSDSRKPKTSGPGEAESEDEGERNEDEVIFANKFAALNVGDANTGEEDDEEEDEEVPSEAGVSRPRPRKSGGKKKKGKGRRGKKSTGKKPSVEANIDNISLESFRIIEDENGERTEYLMAVYSLVQQWVELRQYIQKLWHEVSYGGLNSAAAATVSNIAIGMIKQTQSAIFIDFPGHDAYETVMRTITRGKPDQAQGMFSISLSRMRPKSNMREKVQDVDVDIKEQFLIHTYTDLSDFIVDFQKTRSGSPSKSMLTEIRDWDPNFNLQKATTHQRIKWRRAYTINWLYDLVNVFSSIVVQRNTMKGQHWKYELVDWSIRGSWNKHRRLYGLNEFAGDITSLAMQKIGSDIRQRILPHHVFEMACIVDSLTVSRGWSQSIFRGHVLISPAPMYRPRRDVDLFLDRNNERFGRGFCNAVDVLAQLLDQDSMIHGDPKRHQDQTELLKEIMDDFVNWLGESKYMHGLTTIAPSRFSNTNSNGLWEYSPFLCGAGLVEALELSYAITFVLWDRIPEPMLVIHLHNMLVQKGYLSKEIGLYRSLQEMFQGAFFANGKVPTSDFGDAFITHIQETHTRRAIFERRAIRRTIHQTAVDIHGLLELNTNRFFKQKSLLKIYHEAEWIPDKISDNDITPLSTLAMLRIGQTKHITDPLTGRKLVESTPLVERARVLGVPEDTLLKMSSVLSMLRGNTDSPIIPELLLATPLERPGKLFHSKFWITSRESSERLPSNHELLQILKLDIVNDISGEKRPLSSLNYVWATTQMMILFHYVEDELKRLRNPLWIRAYEENPKMMKEKRVSLASLVLAGEDEECMEVFAQAFEKFRVGWMGHIYWEDLENDDKIMSSLDDEPEEGATCSVM